MSAPFKTGIVVNGFLRTPKFSGIYEMLEKAAARKGITAEIAENTALVTDSAIERFAMQYRVCIFWDKDIRLARRLSDAGVTVVNSPDSIEICDDKQKTCDLLLGEGIMMPKTIALPFTYENVGYTEYDFLREIGEELGYPFVIKENKGSFGAQVYLAEDFEGACEIVRGIGGRPAQAQEFISECQGRDLRVNMVGQECAAAMERRNDNDFRANITNGGSMYRSEVTPGELELSRRVMEIIGLTFAGVDILRSDRGPLLCEVNSNAHFKNIYECTGVDVADRIMDLIIDRYG